MLLVLMFLRFMFFVSLKIFFLLCSCFVLFGSNSCYMKVFLLFGRVCGYVLYFCTKWCDNESKTVRLLTMSDSKKVPIKLVLQHTIQPPRHHRVVVAIALSLSVSGTGTTKNTTNNCYPYRIIYLLWWMFCVCVCILSWIKHEEDLLTAGTRWVRGRGYLSRTPSVCLCLGANSGNKHHSLSWFYYGWCCFFLFARLPAQCLSSMVYGWRATANGTILNIIRFGFCNMHLYIRASVCFVVFVFRWPHYKMLVATHNSTHRNSLHLYVS